MFFFLSKLFQPLLWPFNIALWLLAIALLRSFGGREKYFRSLVLAAFLILTIPSVPIVSNSILRSVENQYPILSAKNAPKADAILVLGGTAGSLDGVRVEVEEVGSRLVPTARLYRAGKAPWVVVSSGSLYQQKSGEWRTEGRDMVDFLIDQGVPAAAILLEERSRNTDENAFYSEAILREKKLHSILLVTNAFHMPRAVALARKHGIKNIFPFPTLPQAKAVSFGWTDFLPSLHGLDASTVSIKEYAGRWAYE